MNSVVIMHLIYMVLEPFLAPAAGAVFALTLLLYLYRIVRTTFGGRKQ